MIDVLDKMSANKAMQFLGLSRHTFEKLVAGEHIPRHLEGEKTVYYITELENFKSTETYTVAVQGVVDKRNSLNDLVGRDWLPETKSYMYQKGISADRPEAQIELLHPAPYSFQDVGHLIRFFTKKDFQSSLFSSFIFHRERWVGYSQTVNLPIA